MTYEEALSFIHGIPRFGKKPGHRRIQNMLRKMGDPHKKLKFIHVAGTNGKGSTSTMLSYILREAGYKTGLYISPFVIDFRERMQIDNEMISQAELAELAQRAHTIWLEMEREGEPPSEFEVVVSIAFDFFARHNCDIVVLEVGMGGRWDSTNVIEESLVSVITSIGLDHMKYLGDTLEAITAEKCGIMKPGGITVTSPDQPPEALAVIMRHCADTGHRLIQPNLSSAEVLGMDIAGSDIVYRDMKLRVPLAGKHQIRNALTVIEAIFAVSDRGFPVTPAQIENGIAKTKFPSRMELFGEKPLVILDGAHNEPGARALAEALPLLHGRNIHAVVSMSADKDAEGSLSLVLAHCKSVIVCAAESNFKAAGAETLLPVAKRYCADVRLTLHSEEAFRQGLARCAENDVLLIFGSLYLTSELRPLAMEYAESRA